MVNWFVSKIRGERECNHVYEYIESWFDKNWIYDRFYCKICLDIIVRRTKNNG